MKDSSLQSRTCTAILASRRPLTEPSTLGRLTILEPQADKSLVIIDEVKTSMKRFKFFFGTVYLPFYKIVEWTTLRHV